MLKIRRPLGRLIFNMGIAIPGKTVFLIETAPCWPLAKFMIDHQFCPVLISLFLGSADFPICPTGSVLHWYWWHSVAVAVCKLHYQNNLEILPISIRPVINWIIVRFSGDALCYREISRITGVSQCVISKVLHHVQDTSSPTQGLHGLQLKTTPWAEILVLFHIVKENRFCSTSMIKVELIRRIRRRIAVWTVQRPLVVPGYHSRHPEMPLTDSRSSSRATHIGIPSP